MVNFKDLLYVISRRRLFNSAFGKAVGLEISLNTCTVKKEFENLFEGKDIIGNIGVGVASSSAELLGAVYAAYP